MRVSSLILTLLPPAGAAHLASVAEVMRGANVGRPGAASALATLVRRGLASNVRRGFYRRTKAGDAIVAAGTRIKPGPRRPGVDAAPTSRPHMRAPEERGRNALRDRAWSALRILKKATIPELLELAADNETTARSHVSDYLNALARHGIVLRLKRRVKGLSPSSPGFAQWSLIRDLGPKAPLVRRGGIVIDRNAGAALPCLGG